VTLGEPSLLRSSVCIEARSDFFFLSESIILDGEKRKIQRSSIIILSIETIGKNVRRKSHHSYRLLPHTYAPCESHKSRGALKFHNLPIEDRESVGFLFPNDYAKLHEYASHIQRASECGERAPHMFMYADLRAFKIQIASESLPIGFFGHSALRKISSLEPFQCKLTSHRVLFDIL